MSTNRTSYGLHLEPEGLRVVGINRCGKEYLVRYQAFFPSREGYLSAQDFSAVNLEDAVKSIDIKGARVVASMPGKFINIRYFQLPHMPLREPEKAVEWEMRLLSPGQNVLVRVLRLGRRMVNGSSLLNMMGISVPQQVANDFYLFFSTSGLRLVAMEPEFIALWYLLYYSGLLSGNGGEYIVAAYLGVSSSVLLVCRKSAIIFSKVMPVGTKWKKTSQVNNGNRNGLLKEIAQSLRHIASAENFGIIGEVLLCGHAGGILAGEESLEYGDIIFRILNAEFGGGEVLAPEMAVAVGLALRGLCG